MVEHSTENAGVGGSNPPLPTISPDSPGSSGSPGHSPKGEFEEKQDKDPFDVGWKERILVLGSVFAAIIALIVLGLVFDPERTHALLILIPSSFFVLGKFLPLASLKEGWGFGPYELGFVIWIMDSVTVLLLVYSFQALYRIGWIRRSLERVHQNAELVLHAFPILQRVTVVGVVLFVLFPIAGTGAIGGSFIGMILGLHRFTLIACVSLGGFLGGMGMAFATVHFRSAVETLQKYQSSPLLIGGLIAVLVIFIFLLTRAYQKALKKAKEERLKLPSSNLYQSAVRNRAKRAKKANR